MTWTDFSDATRPGGFDRHEGGPWFDPFSGGTYERALSEGEGGYSGVPGASNVTIVAYGVTWSNDTLAWGQLSTVTDSGGGVDFEYRASAQFPMIASSETARAIPALDDPIEEP